MSPSKPSSNRFDTISTPAGLPPGSFCALDRGLKALDMKLSDECTTLGKSIDRFLSDVSACTVT